VNLISLRNDRLVVRFDYDPGYIIRVGNIPSAKYDSTNKLWTVGVEYLDGVLFNFPDFPITSDVQNILSKRKTVKFIDKAPESINGIKLYQHQIDNVNTILNKKKVLLADEQGLGKTYSALVAAELAKLPVYIIAPKSLHAMWRKEAEAVGIEPADIISWAKIPDPPDDPNIFCILDEAHALQNMRSKRTQDVIYFCKEAPMIVAMTGTPLKNGRPINLFGILTVLKHPLSYSKRLYEVNYCNAKPTRFTKWDCNGASNLHDLYTKVSNILIRHRKEDCLDLPDKTRVIREAELTAEAKRIFNSTMTRYANEWREKVRKGWVNPHAEKLVMYSACRQAASLAKIPSAVEIAEELYDNNRQGVFFVSYRQSANALAEKLRELGYSVGVITGDYSINQRNESITKFQASKDNFIICTFEAGGVGITLTAASYVTLVDRAWTPGIVLQAEDRVHRISQKNAVTSTWLSIPAYDDPIDQMLIDKSKNISHVLTGNPEMEKIELGSSNELDSVFSKIFMNF